MKSLEELPQTEQTALLRKHSDEIIMLISLMKDNLDNNSQDVVTFSALALAMVRFAEAKKISFGTLDMLLADTHNEYVNRPDKGWR